MINYQEAEREIKQHFKNRKDLCLDMVDISADILSILRNLDDKTCFDCNRRKICTRTDIKTDMTQAGEPEREFRWTICAKNARTSSAKTDRKEESEICPLVKKKIKKKMNEKLRWNRWAK